MNSRQSSYAKQSFFAKSKARAEALKKAKKARLNGKTEIVDDPVMAGGKELASEIVEDPKEVTE